MSQAKMISGFGQFHTNEEGKSKRIPYEAIDLAEIRALVDHPQQVDKAKAQWLIPSTLPSRTFKQQEDQGHFWLLWADIDKEPPCLDTLQSKVYFDLLSESDHEIYTSRSAREDYQKSRILIPLGKPLAGADWLICQQLLNDKLEASGIVPDRKSEGAAQLCYLPNRGQFYDSRSVRDGKPFDPLSTWSTDIVEKQKQKAKAFEDVDRRKAEIKAKREARSHTAESSPIAAFNAAFSVGDILIQAGYDQDGSLDSYRHPQSESGSYSASVRDGRVHTLSSADPLYTGGSGGGAHDAFSAFTVLFNHGDQSRAIKDAGDNWLTIGGESWNTVKQREYKQSRLAGVSETKVTEDQQEADGSETFAVPDLDAADVRDGTIFTRPLTEHGNACRLLDLHGDLVRYVPETGAWIMWRDGAWTWDVDGANVRASAASLHKIIYREGGGDGIRHDDAIHYVRWSRASQKLNTVKNSVALFSDMTCVRLPLSTIDADAMLVGFDQARQVADLRSGKVRPAATDDFITKSLNVSEVGESSKAVRWLAFLDQVFDQDKELIDWLHRWCGYLITGETCEQFLIFCFGLGANGKSIFAETLKHIVGDYARAISVETLCESKRQAGGASPDLADLVGARLAMTTETEEGRALAETLVKSLVSGDSISARPLYGSPIQFAPQFKLLMLGNHRPVIRGTDHGIWRRIMLVPFNRTFSPSERDPQLLDKLKEESPHILAWIIEGCLKWQKNHLTDVPRIVREQTDSYRAEQDVIGQWLIECTEPAHASIETSANELYESYKPWAVTNGFGVMNRATLGRRLSERGYRKRATNGKVLWGGVAVIHCAANDSGVSYGGASRGY